jgi:FkbM family methyltransferase
MSQVSTKNQMSPALRELTQLFNTESHVTIFEIGSCDGQDAIKYAQAFPNSRIFAFEPVPANYKKILENILASKTTNVDAFQMALSKETGETEMYISAAADQTNAEADDKGNKSSSLLAPDKHLEVFPWCKFDETIKVKTDTIRNFCEARKIENIDFIHLDVQGAELMVLEGAGSFLQNIKSIWLEVEHIALYKDQPLHNHVEQFMNNHGFVLKKFRVGGFSGDQFYVNKKFIADSRGSIFNSYLSAKSVWLRSSPYITINRYLRKLRFLLKA